MAYRKPLEEYKTIKTTRYDYVKDGSKWKLQNKKEYICSDNYYENFVDDKTTRFFRRLGGYEHKAYGYTPRGYKVVSNTSINPNRDHKVVTKFDFDNSQKLYERARKRFYR